MAVRHIGARRRWHVALDNADTVLEGGPPGAPVHKESKWWPFLWPGGTFRPESRAHAMADSPFFFTSASSFSADPLGRFSPRSH